MKNIVGSILLSMFLAALFAFGVFQLYAIATGLEILGVPTPLAYIVAAGTTLTPFVGGALGVYGAVAGWEWTITQAILIFFAPLIFVIAVGVMLMTSAGSIVVILKLRERIRGAKAQDS